MAAVFGFLFGILELGEFVFSAVQLGQELFAPEKDMTTTVRVYLGESSNIEASLSGHVPGITLWNRFGLEIGSTGTNGEGLPQGSFTDILVAHDEKIGNAPPEYMSVNAGGIDAICIAWLTVTFPDGRFTNFLPGDVGFLCGMPWFESSRELTTNGLAPKCLWIDRNGSGGLKQGFGVHLRDFAENEAQGFAYANRTELACKSGPRFRMYDQLRAGDPILYFDPDPEYTEEGLDVDPSLIINNPGKTTLRRRDLGTEDELVDSRTQNATNPGSLAPIDGAKMFEGRLVVSNMTRHSAQNLCNSGSSFGPDFIALSEGYYCDMTRKELFKLCSAVETSCCFDLEQQSMRSCVGSIRGSSLARREWTNVTKTYTSVERWGMSDDS